MSDKNAQLAASRSMLERLFRDLLALLQSLDTDAVHWEPPLTETNSMAVLVQHTMGSLERWLSKAADDPFHTDREEEFRQRLTKDELVATIESTRANALKWLAVLEQVDFSQERTARLWGATKDFQPTVAWCVQHALTHAFEHWGQIQLTRQLRDTAR